MALFPLCEALPGSPDRLRERIGGLIGILILLFFGAVGIDMVIHPRRHMNAYLRRGGEMLREWNEMQVQSLGLLLTCGSGWALYQIAPSVWLYWFR